MAWYGAGSIAVTNGSGIVTGAGTDFVGNVAAGEALLAPDGRIYEIASVQSATQLTLTRPYLAGSGGGLAYQILPTQSFARDLALAAAALLGSFAAVRDGIGQGLIGDGTVAAPGLRFAADQDTGLRRYSANGLALVAGGRDAITLDPTGAAITGSAQVMADEFPALIIVKNGFNAWFLGGSGVAGDNHFTVRLGTSDPALRVDTVGNLLVGVPAADSHYLAKGGGQATKQLTIGQAGIFYSGLGGLGNPAASAANFTFNNVTGRSINAGGTINANGADYAEYMTKAPGCGTIAAGDVCGVDRDGRLTRTWSDAVSYVVKSTDPAYVGGDTWGTDLPPKPERAEDEDEAAFAARLAPWEAELEAARQLVDRIAFSGQVPVNVDSGTLDACEDALADGEAAYLVAQARGAGIGAQMVRESAMTLPLYMRRIGKVWAIRDGRPWIDVQHG